MSAHPSAQRWHEADGRPVVPGASHGGSAPQEQSASRSNAQRLRTLPAGLSDPQLAWQQLGQADAVRRLQLAFGVATGLPLTLVPAELSKGCPNGAEPRGAFCIDGCMGRDSGTWCLRLLQ